MDEIDYSSRYFRHYQQERLLTLLLLAAMRRVDDDYDAFIMARFSRGLYFRAVNRTLDGFRRIDPNLEEIEQAMHAIIEEGHKVEKLTWPWSRAIEYLQEHETNGAVRLLEQSGSEMVQMWKLAEYITWFPDPVVGDLSNLSAFALTPFAEGFVLRLPDRRHTDLPAPFTASQQLFDALAQAKDWGVKTRSYDIGTLNQQIDRDPVGLILTSEALHDHHLFELAKQVVDGLPERRVVLIAGPSSSGKTTFSRRLMIQLRAMTVHSLPIPMDDYFVDRDFCPRDDKGNYDFEHFDCLDHHALTEDVAKLLRGDSIHLRRFDFKSGKPSHTEKEVYVRDNEVLILEGIHGLNPNLLADIPREKITRIFVSALTNLSVDRHSRIATSDLRLLRRIVRDYRTRGHTPEATLQRWDSVREGEDKWIFPFQENADIFFNSALTYEIASLKKHVQPLLDAVSLTGTAAYHASRVRALLDLVKPLDPMAIPLDSVIREFIGGGVWEG